MASQYHQHLVKTTTLFFKPIHSESLTHKLMIPRKFVKKYGDVFSDKVFLKLPNGEEWKVNLGRRNGDIWLENGWREFAEYHSLFNGRLLVFGYEDSASHRLKVLIMDLTTSEEIDYPSYHEQQESPLPCLLQQRKKDINRKRVHNVEGTLCSEDAELYQTRKKCEASSQRGRFDSKVLKVKGEDFKGNRGRTLERAKAFKSKYPSFVFVVRPSYINSSSQVALPSEFAKKFLASKKTGQSTNLRTPNGRRVWVSKFTTRKQGTTIKFQLSPNGWKAFVKDNDLKVDDVCVFELMKGATHEIDFRVSIFRNTNPSDAPLCDQATGKHTPKNKRVKIKTETEEIQVSPKKPKFTKATTSREAAGHSFHSENPFFKVTIGLSDGQAVPVPFARKYFKEGKHVVELHDRDRSWTVKLIRIACGSQDYGFFSEGWAAFARENDLQKGDHCFFELVNRDDDTCHESFHFQTLLTLIHKRFHVPAPPHICYFTRFADTYIWSTSDNILVPPPRTSVVLLGYRAISLLIYLSSTQFDDHFHQLNHSIDKVRFDGYFKTNLAKP